MTKELKDLLEKAFERGCMYGDALSKAYDFNKLIKEIEREKLTLTDVVKSFYCCKEVIGLKEQCNSQCKECKKFVKDNFQQ